jgi:hypothetical protein
MAAKKNDGLSKGKLDNPTPSKAANLDNPNTVCGTSRRQHLF